MNNQTPKKPDNMKAQVSMLWDAVYNHVFSRLKWLDKKFTFVLIFLGLLLASIGILIGLIAQLLNIIVR